MKFGDTLRVVVADCAFRNAHSALLPGHRKSSARSKAKTLSRWITPAARIRAQRPLAIVMSVDASEASSSFAPGRSLRAGAASCQISLYPGLPQYAVRTQRARLVRVASTYCTWGPGGEPPCASGTYPTREAGTRSVYVPNGGAGATRQLRSGRTRAARRPGEAA